MFGNYYFVSADDCPILDRLYTNSRYYISGGTMQGEDYYYSYLEEREVELLTDYERRLYEDTDYLDKEFYKKYGAPDVEFEAWEDW